MKSIIRGLSLNIRAGLHEAGPWVILALVLWWVLTRVWGWIGELWNYAGHGEGLGLGVAAIILTLLIVGYVRRKLRLVRSLSARARTLIEKLPILGRLAQVVRRLSELALRDPEHQQETRSVSLEIMPGCYLLALVTREGKTDKGIAYHLSIPLGGSLTALPMIVNANDPRIRRLQGIGGDEIATGVITYGQGFTPAHDVKLYDALFAEPRSQSQAE